MVPQLLLTPAARHMGDDLLAIFGLNQAAYAERFRQGRPADPQLLYMGGYRPEIEAPDGLLTADVAADLEAFATLTDPPADLVAALVSLGLLDG